MHVVALGIAASPIAMTRQSSTVAPNGALQPSALASRHARWVVWGFSRRATASRWNATSLFFYKERGRPALAFIRVAFPARSRHPAYLEWVGSYNFSMALLSLGL